MQIGVLRQKVHVVHRNVVEIVLGKQEAHVDQRRPIEAISVDLVDNENVVRDTLVVQEPLHVWCELQKLLKAVPERHNQCESGFLIVVFANQGGRCLGILSSATSVTAITSAWKRNV